MKKKNKKESSKIKKTTSSKQSNGKGNLENSYDIIPVSGMYENWFLDYASYVILERAVPAIEDGLKPVQRRILHAMREMDDGRYNKVANIIGQTMQYHPHGDASIGEAIINIGQKDLLIDTQGNWGDIRTGDGAAAPRYIEARPTKFALEVVFNPDITEWQLSYDGRKKEPVTLPIKFPLLLAHGVDGIAVGLSTKILPHNFCELIQASIKVLRKEDFDLYPDFSTGGMMDASNYTDGIRGGKVRVRAKIEKIDNKNLLIREIPFGTTTTSIMESIVKANDNGKIKIKKVVDNTAKDVEILIQLMPGISPDITIDALYAFTECEVSVSPNACVIVSDKPLFLGVKEILKISTHKTVALLKRELDIKRDDLKERLLFSSLEKLFIEKRIYRSIEECETWEAVIKTIDKGLKPYKSLFYREITEQDIVNLTEIKIKRISKYDAFKADELMKKLGDELKETEKNLKNLTAFAVRYFEGLLERYGKGKERKTEIRAFDTIQATVVAAANEKLYVNRQDGFVGYGLKKDEYISDCSDLDDIIVFRRDGKCQVSRIAEKMFMGKDIIHVAVFKKNDDRMVYNMVYTDGESGVSYIKRFQITGITRDKEYDLTKGGKNSKVLYFSANLNGEAETVTITLSQSCRAKIKVFEFDFAELAIKGRSSIGNIVTKYPVKKIQFKSGGVSTLGGKELWYDATIGRLNTDERGKTLGNFKEDDLILVIYQDGQYELLKPELTNRFDSVQVLVIEKYNPKTVISAVHYDGKLKNYYVKRFQIETATVDKKFSFISEHQGSKLILASTAKSPEVELIVLKGAKKVEQKESYELDSLIDVKGWKSIGNKLSNYEVKNIRLIANEKITNTVQKKEEVVKENKKQKEKNKSSTKKEKKSKASSKKKFYKVGQTIELSFDKKKK